MRLFDLFSVVLDSSVWEAAMTSFISHGFPKTVQGGVARKTDTRAQLQKDGSEVGPAEEVAVHVREVPSVPRWERGPEAAGPRDLAEPSLSQSGTGRVLALQLERQALALSWLTHACTGQGTK